MIRHMRGAGYLMIGWMKIPIYRGVCNEWVVDSPQQDDSFLDLCLKPNLPGLNCAHLMYTWLGAYAEYSFCPHWSCKTIMLCCSSPKDSFEEVLVFLCLCLRFHMLVRHVRIRYTSTCSVQFIVCFSQQSHSLPIPHIIWHYIHQYR